MKLKASAEHFLGKVEEIGERLARKLDEEIKANGGSARLHIAVCVYMMTACAKSLRKYPEWPQEYTDLAMKQCHETNDVVFIADHEDVDRKATS